jgi:hypothetical protein
MAVGVVIVRFCRRPMLVFVVFMPFVSTMVVRFPGVLLRAGRSFLIFIGLARRRPVRLPSD